MIRIMARCAVVGMLAGLYAVAVALGSACLVHLIREPVTTNYGDIFFGGLLAGYVTYLWSSPLNRSAG